MAQSIRLLLLALLPWVLSAQPAMDSLTQGLLHWWPDPAEGTDRITGRRGVRRGFGPVAEESEVRFGYAAGWMELGPGITNQTFTVAFWVRPSFKNPPVTDGATILSQDSGLDDGWTIWTPTADGLWLMDNDIPRPENIPISWELGNGWRHVVVRVNGAVLGATLSLDGPVVGVMPFTPPRVTGPLTVGNNLFGNSPWDGDLRDLRFYDRELIPAEIRLLAERGVPPVAPAMLPNAITVPVRTVDVRQAGPTEYRRTQFTTAQGLPNAEVQCLVQARSGALWLGFEGGLARFDGRKFELTEATAPGFAQAGADVMTLAEDAGGGLWLGLFHGLVRRQGDGWTTYTNIGPARFVRRVLPAADGTVWLAGYRDGPLRGQAQLRRLDPATGRLLADLPVPGQVRDLRPAPGGLWVATDDPPALWHYAEATGEVTLIVHLSGISPADSTTKGHGGRPEPVVRVTAGAAALGVRAEVWQEPASAWQWARVWLGTNGPSLTWVRPAAGDWHLAELGPSASLPEWVATPHGLLRERGGQWKRIELGTEGAMAGITVLAENLEGGVWAATEADGLWLVQPRLVQVLTQRDGLLEDEVRSVVRAGDGTLLAGGPGGFTRIDPTFREPPTVTRVREAGGVVTPLPDGSLCLSGALAFMQLNGTNLTHYALASRQASVPDVLGEVSQMHPDDDGNVWLVAERCVCQIPRLPLPDRGRQMIRLSSGEHSQWLNDLPPRVQLRGLAAGPNGVMWVGSVGGGLFRLTNGVTENLSISDYPPDSPCVPLGFAADGTLWLGGEAGLGAWRDGRFHWARPANGLPESVVTDAEEAEGYVWLSGRRGLHAIRRDELDEFFDGRRPQVNALSLGIADGLLSTETRMKVQPVMAQAAGRLWVATVRGLAHFSPREVLAALKPPPVAIETLKADGRALSLDAAASKAGIRLRPGQGRVVEVAFSSLSFAAVRPATFRYHHQSPEGARTAETAEGHVVLPNLRPGRHVFSVTALSAHGPASERPAQLEFFVEPHFHETRTFFAFCGVAGLGLVTGYVSLRLRRARRLAALEQERRLTEERRRIAQDMHDELGSGLTRLAWLAEAPPVASGNSAIPPAGASSGAVARQLLRSLDETVWAVNPAKDRLDSVVNYLGGWSRDFFADTPVQFTLDLPVTVPEAPVPAEWRHHVFLAVKEACANALKHSGATQASLTLRLAAAAGALEITLTDNGCGFVPGASTIPTGDKPGGNGLGNLRRRAAELRADLQIESAPGQGTTVRLIVPLPK